MAKNKVYVIGHICPDTDTTVSAIAYAEFLKKQKIEAVAAISGDLNLETKFVLKTFGFKAPQKLQNAAGKNLVLVDHNEKSQMVLGADQATIIEVLDHHKIIFENPTPIKFYTEPLGSTATMVAKIMLTNKFKITKSLAGILTAAILSDTVVFKSTTTTETDIKIAKILGKIANITNLKKFGIEIKKQKSSLKGISAAQILKSDYKIFEVEGYKFGIGQIEVVDLTEVKMRLPELIKEMENACANEGLKLVALMITDIISEGSLIIANGDVLPIEKAFGKSYSPNGIYLEKMMSRKKDFLPLLMKVIRN